MVAGLFETLSKIEQGLLCSCGMLANMSTIEPQFHESPTNGSYLMKNRMLWRLEVNDPLRFSEWRPLWEFADIELSACQELRDELNKTNAPIILRIVPTIGTLGKADLPK